MPRFSAPACVAFAALAAMSLAFAQSEDITPPPYAGVTTIVHGVFVTPVAGAPFSAVVTIESARQLADGSVAKRHTYALIARDSQGRIYNERRPMVPASINNIPEVLSARIFDPETRMSTMLFPGEQVARQRTLAPRPPQAQASAKVCCGPGQEDLGTETMQALAVHGTRYTRTIPAAVSETGAPMTITNEYWYSDEVHMNILTRQSDPRTGQQTVTLTQVKRGEPDAALFRIPADYRVVKMDRANP